jgi:4-amino-4-deoxy-L-arabinose transferase-like glycosyltransferase
MNAVLAVLFGAGLTVAVCLTLGKLLLRGLRLRFYRQEEHVLSFVAGSACLSLMVFLLAALRHATLDSFLVLGVVVMAVGEFRGVHRPLGDSVPPLGRSWRVAFWCLFAVFTYLYFFNALAPEVSPDGSQYHLGLVSRYLLAHGFCRITTSMYASLSQGAEMLFLYAFAFGKHSAAAMVHFAFLVTLPLGMLCYGRRFGFPKAAAAAALLVYLSPIAGYDGSVAYNDVAVACVVFALFYVLQIWDQERASGLLVVIGLLAGFAYAIKYTAFPAVPYAVGLVGWKTYRAGRKLLKPLAIVAACAFLMIGPWALKDWITVDNPFAPFANKWFPNAYSHVGFEQGYRAQLAEWGGVKNKLHIPIEATVRGEKLQGLIGPVFLLAPLGLLALRDRTGRQLLLAALVFLTTYPANIGTRFLIPALPFIALAMMLVLEKLKGVAPVVVAAHALTAWPACVNLYCGQYAMRLEGAPVRAALRIEPEERYLARRLYWYPVSRMLDERVPADARIFAFSAPPQAYTARTILVSYEAALNNNLSDMLWAIRTREWQPTRRLTFAFPPQPLRRLRLAQTARSGTDYWSVSEFRVLFKDQELPREQQWRLRARPNPFEVQMAFDGNPMTRWRSWQGLSHRDYIEIDFGRPLQVDSVVLDTTPDQSQARLRLDGQPDGGGWQWLGESPQETVIPAPEAMRWMMSRELRWQGIEYLLLVESDFIADDVRKNTRQWGLTLIGERNGARLYRID